MDYPKLVEMIPAEKLGPLSDQLTSFIMGSKNDDKMPSSVAKCMLAAMQSGITNSKSGIGVLLEAAYILEPEKTLGALNEMQLANVTEQMKSS